MGLYLGGLIIGRIIASVIDLGGLFSGVLIFGRGCYQNFRLDMRIAVVAVFTLEDGKRVQMGNQFDEFPVLV